MSVTSAKKTFLPAFNFTFVPNISMTRKAGKKTLKILRTIRKYSLAFASHSQSSDNDLSGSLARFSRSIRNIFQTGGSASASHSHSRTPVYDSAVDGNAEPAASTTAEILSDGPMSASPLRGHDLGVEVTRRAYSHCPQRSRHALFASDGGSSVGSRGFEAEATLPTLLGEEKAENSDEKSLEGQLNRFEKGVKGEDWRPVVLLVEDTANLRLLTQYLATNVGERDGLEGRKGASGRCGGRICLRCRWKKWVAASVRCIRSIRKSENLRKS